ncbi:hypothetical protein Y032_0002g1098 [Ancylostoma ceylanicum]|uniref:SCP domain-containing protein n=1 Tax=Ancylostoma ceylanicum TaxID=53326 RepID=A0A016W0H2_9BILA|nr:hypothetical protein Y032_0002g1098 [Ancylostoma ceylanicum]
MASSTTVCALLLVLFGTVEGQAAAPGGPGTVGVAAVPGGPGTVGAAAAPGGPGTVGAAAAPGGPGTVGAAAPGGPGTVGAAAAPGGPGTVGAVAPPGGSVVPPPPPPPPPSPPVAKPPPSPPSASNTNGTNITNTSTTSTAGNVTTTIATTTTVQPTRPPWPKPNCGNPALTNELRRAFLDMHNDFRGRLARGQTEVSAGWGIAPPAALMYRMKYDCGAESYAQQSVANCRRTELPSYATGGHKQNLFVLNSAHANPKAVIHYALSRWWSQLARFGMRSNMMFYQSEYRRGARNVLKWAKMAWWNNRRVGCTVKNCGSFYLVSCMYSPGGLHINQHVYRVAAVCSGCPHGQCDGQALCRW